MPRPDSPPLSRGVILRGIGVVLAVALGAVGVWLIVTGKSQKDDRLGVLAGLWGLLVGAFCLFGSRTHLGERSESGLDAAPRPVGTDIELRSRATEVEWAEEVKARRAHEARIEQLLRQEIHNAVSGEVSTLRTEIAKLRTDLLEKVGGQLRLERIETTRVIGSDLEALQDEVRALKEVTRDPDIAGGLLRELGAARMRPVSGPERTLDARIVDHQAASPRPIGAGRRAPFSGEPAFEAPPVPRPAAAEQTGPIMTPRGLDQGSSLRQPTPSAPARTGSPPVAPVPPDGLLAEGPPQRRNQPVTAQPMAPVPTGPPARAETPGLLAPTNRLARAATDAPEPQPPRQPQAPEPRQPQAPEQRQPQAPEARQSAGPLTPGTGRLDAAGRTRPEPSSDAVFAGLPTLTPFVDDAPAIADGAPVSTSPASRERGIGPGPRDEHATQHAVDHDLYEGRRRTRPGESPGAVPSVDHSTAAPLPAHGVGAHPSQPPLPQPVTGDRSAHANGTGGRRRRADSDDDDLLARLLARESH